MHNGSKARMINGIISAVIVVFFLAHGVLGVLESHFALTSPLTWVVWIGMIVVGAHVVASIVTSWEQMTDPERPPSPRKKRHLALKWATGILLALVVCAHVILPKTSMTAALVIVLLSVVLAVHICVGSKSLLKDLGIPRRYKYAFRVVVCAFAALFALATVFAIL